MARQSVITGGRSSGFDYLRLLLAVSVVCTHSVLISYGPLQDGELIWNTPARPLFRMILPMFFALSGYLVAGSLDRTRTLFGFLGLRVIRIYPALGVEVLLSAFVLGPLLTTLPLSTYFTDPQFTRYLLNVFGDVHFLLPGVFKDNPMAAQVNLQLWTVPYELLCYITLTGLGLLGVLRRRVLVPFAIVLLTMIIVGMRFHKYGGAFPRSVSAFSGYILVICFLAGIAIYLYREMIPWSRTGAVVCAIVSLLLIGPIPHGEYIAPVPIAYVTVYLGLTNIKRLPFLRHADLSYGIFLYGFVVQQTVVYLAPWTRHWYMNIAISLPIIVLIAGFSWHFIEKPALSLRKYLARMEAWHIEWIGRRRAVNVR